MNATRATFLAAASFVLSAVSTAATVTLHNGDRFSGVLLAESDAAVTIEHSLLGRIEVPRSEISTLQPDPVTEAAQTAVEVATTDDGFLGTGWLTDWKRRVEIGVTGATGKSENMDVTAGFSADYEDEETRWAQSIAYQRNESDGEVSENNLSATLQRDWLRPGSPWFHFAEGLFDWDEFKDWDYRLAASGGAGYEFVRRDNYRLRGRAGLGANQTFGGTREEFSPEALLGFDVDWRINPHQSLTFANTLYPNLSDSGEFRNLTELSWTLNIDREAGLGLKLGLSNEYDSLAGDDVDRNDFQYTGSLVWGL